MNKLIGQRVTFFCVNYIYTGKLKEILEHDVVLSNAAIVYETGPLHDAKWKDAQALPNDLFISRQAIESYTILK